MDDADLTKKAIEELMREMDEYKELEKLPTERKKNPLGRPNKRFLGRTINSMMTHNKRQSDRNHQRCQRKLKELDDKKTRREFRNQARSTRKSSDAESSNIISSDSEEEYTKKKSKSVKKKKKKRRKKKQKSSSSSSSTTSSSSSSSSSSSETESSSSSSNSKHKNRKKKRHKKPIKDEEYADDCYEDYPNERGYYVNPNMAYAVMAYNQMNHLLQQQQRAQQEMVKEELEDSVEIPSDLSLSEHSETGLNISLNSSSAEEDENGILTFKLSSDEEGNSPKSNEAKEDLNKNHNSPKESENSDRESIQSHISLESEDSHKVTNRECNQICLLSSSASDSEDLEIIETIADKTNELLNSETNSKENAIVNESLNKENNLNIEYESIGNVNIEELNEKNPALEKEENEQKTLVIHEKCQNIDETNKVVEDIEANGNDKPVHMTNNKETLTSMLMVNLTDE